MPGTKEGSAKRIATQRKKYGKDFFARNGALGGAKSKGRKLTQKTKRKISQSQKRRFR